MDVPGHDKQKRKVMKTFADIADKYPAAMKQLRNVEFVRNFGSPETLAHVDIAQAESIDPKLRRKYKKGDMILRFKRQYDESTYTDEASVLAGWQPPNTNNVEGTMYHELGHVLSQWSGGEVNDKLSEWLGEYYKDHPEIGKRPEDNDSKLIALMKKEASGYSFRYDDPSAGIYGGSKPLSIDDHEFTSDAFADVMMNGDAAWALSKFIYGKMIEVFDSHAK